MELDRSELTGPLLAHSSSLLESQDAAAAAGGSTPESLTELLPAPVALWVMYRDAWDKMPLVLLC